MFDFAKYKKMAKTDPNYSDEAINRLVNILDGKFDFEIMLIEVGIVMEEESLGFLEAIEHAIKINEEDGDY